MKKIQINLGQTLIIDNDDWIKIKDGECDMPGSINSVLKSYPFDYYEDNRKVFGNGVGLHVV